MIVHYPTLGCLTIIKVFGYVYYLKAHSVVVVSCLKLKSRALITISMGWILFCGVVTKPPLSVLTNIYNPSILNLVVISTGGCDGNIIQPPLPGCLQVGGLVCPIMVGMKPISAPNLITRFIYLYLYHLRKHKIILV
jgi:hypothetical protein